MQIFQELNDQRLTIVLVTHEPDVAQFAGSHIRFRAVPQGLKPRVYFALSARLKLVP